MYYTLSEGELDHNMYTAVHTACKAESINSSLDYSTWHRSTHLLEVTAHHTHKYSPPNINKTTPWILQLQILSSSNYTDCCISCMRTCRIRTYVNPHVRSRINSTRDRSITPLAQTRWVSTKSSTSQLAAFFFHKYDHTSINMYLVAHHVPADGLLNLQ